MATQVSARNCCWLDGITVAAQDLRLQQLGGLLTAAAASGSTGIAATAGVRPGQGNPLVSTWTSGMSFTLAAGVCYVQGSAAANSGLYELVLDTTTTLTCTTSDPTNPRIDSVIAVVVDNGNNTSTAVFKILAGTPAGSPSAPALPANALRLCNITVGANVSTLSSGVFSDQRVWSVAAGGVLPYGNAALGTAIAGPDGTYVDDLNTGRLRRIISGTARIPKVGAFAPVSGTTTNALITTGGSQPLNASVTVDGATEIKITLRWNGVKQLSATVGDVIQLSAFVDSTQLDTVDVRIDGTSTSTGDGGMWQVWTTPSAGSHTVSFNGLVLGTTSSYTLSQIWLRVEPSFS